MVVAVAGGPPGGDAVDQLAPVGEHDAAALGAHHRQRRRAPSSSAHRAARCGRARRRTSRAAGPVIQCVRSASIQSCETAILPVASNGHRLECSHSTNSRRRSSASSSARACAARSPRPTALDGIWVERNGRRLLSFSCNDYLNSDPPSGASKRRRSRRSSATASAPAPRGWSPAIIRSSPSSKARLARSKGTEAACVFGSGYLANSRHHSGAGRPRRSRADRRAGACLPVGRRAALARHGAAVPPQRHGACRGAARRAPRPAPARADRDRRRVLHGRRPRAAAGAVGARDSATMPG